MGGLSPNEFSAQLLRSVMRQEPLDKKLDSQTLISEFLGLESGPEGVFGRRLLGYVLRHNLAINGPQRNNGTLSALELLHGKNHEDPTQKIYVCIHPTTRLTEMEAIKLTPRLHGSYPLRTIGVPQPITHYEEGLPQCGQPLHPRFFDTSEIPAVEYRLVLARGRSHAETSATGSPLFGVPDSLVTGKPDQRSFERLLEFNEVLMNLLGDPTPEKVANFVKEYRGGSTRTPLAATRSVQPAVTARTQRSLPSIPPQKLEFAKPSYS